MCEEGGVFRCLWRPEYGIDCLWVGVTSDWKSHDMGAGNQLGFPGRARSTFNHGDISPTTKLYLVVLLACYWHLASSGSCCISPQSKGYLEALIKSPDTLYRLGCLTVLDSPKGAWLSLRSLQTVYLQPTNDPPRLHHSLFHRGLLIPLLLLIHCMRYCIIHLPPPGLAIPYSHLFQGVAFFVCIICLIFTTNW